MEKRTTFVDFLIQLIFIILFVILLVWLFPTKDWLKENYFNNQRLKEIKSQGGVESEIERISTLASDFKKRIEDLPLEIHCNDLGNSVTGVFCVDSKADDVVDALKNDYGICVNPNGGEIGEKMFRVGHIGNLTLKDNDVLIDALHDLEKRGILK